MPWGLLVPPFFSEGKRGDRFEHLCFKVCFACLGDYRYPTFLRRIAEKVLRVGDTQEQSGLVKPRAGVAQGQRNPGLVCPGLVLPRVGGFT